jgi:polyhydroxyalkanoate synthase
MNNAATTQPRAHLNSLTSGVSTPAMMMAFEDWLTHLARNPEEQVELARTGDTHFWQCFEYFMEDAQRQRAHPAPARDTDYPVGEKVAVTPGKVILRNRLIELIQYSPSVGAVLPEPILIVPAWIMKYYILDLSPANSLIKYLVDQGHTVFAVSWTNPDEQDRDLGLDDYLQLGLMDVLDAVGSVVPDQQVHAVGYSLGGTLMAIAAAALARDGDDRLATVSLLAAQTDFTEPGEFGLVIDESQISTLEDMMWNQGYIDNTQLAGAFQLMSAKDLAWSRMLKDHLLGECTPMSDLMAWNADVTRLPYRMHTEYLRSMFLHNDLASGRYIVNDKPVALVDIQCPIFCVGTMRDHVAPWRSVYKLNLLTNVETTFVLSSGGHNVGIVNPPGVAGRSYQMLTREHDGKYVDPELWLKGAPLHEGSWWPAWSDWLKDRSGMGGAPPPIGAPSHGLRTICAAPGAYVLQK